MSDQRAHLLRGEQRPDPGSRTPQLPVPTQRRRRAGCSDTRKRSNQVLKHVIAATVEPLGYRVTRADTIDQSGQITTQILERLLNAELVVADLTDQSPNVFYELAVRYALRKPFVHLVATGQTIPFDIQGLRTIFFTHTDLDSVHEAKNRLKGMVESIEEGGDIETPLAFTVDLQQLRQSENSEARGIADLMDEVKVIKRSLLVNSKNARSPDFLEFRRFVEFLSETGRLRLDDEQFLITGSTSDAHNRWVKKMISQVEDPWSAPPANTGSGFSDEPPF